MSVRALRKGSFQSTSLIAAVVLLLIMFVSGAYFFIVPTTDVDPRTEKDLALLDENRSLWQQQKPESFTYVVERRCACSQATTEPYVATETKDRRTAVFPEFVRGKFDDPATTPDSPVWISELFATIEAAIESGELLTARYDYRLGYPVLVRTGLNGDSGAPVEVQVRDFQTNKY